jgi:chromosomal replication initiation ATPase DnaA
MCTPLLASGSAPPLIASTKWSNNRRHIRACRAIEDLVAGAFRVPPAELYATTRRSAPVAAARQAAMYLARVTLQLSYREVAVAFGRDPRTVAHACRRVEERREQPRLDTLMSRLEDACAAMVAAAAEGNAS